VWFRVWWLGFRFQGVNHQIELGFKVLVSGFGSRVKPQNRRDRSGSLSESAGLTPDQNPEPTARESGRERYI